MNSTLFSHSRRWLLVLAMAFVLALTAMSASAWFDQMAGTSLTPAAFACDPQGSGCG